MISFFAAAIVNKSFADRETKALKGKQFLTIPYMNFLYLYIVLMNNRTILCFDTRSWCEHFSWNVLFSFCAFYRDYQYLIERKNNKNSLV